MGKPVASSHVLYGRRLTASASPDVTSGMRRMAISNILNDEDDEPRAKQRSRGIYGLETNHQSDSSPARLATMVGELANA